MVLELLATRFRVINAATFAFFEETGGVFKEIGDKILGRDVVIDRRVACGDRVSPKHTLDGCDPMVRERQCPCVHAKLRVDQHIDAFMVKQLERIFLVHWQLHVAVGDAPKFRSQLVAVPQKVHTPIDHDVESRAIQALDDPEQQFPHGMVAKPARDERDVAFL